MYNWLIETIIVIIISNVAIFEGMSNMTPKNCERKATSGRYEDTMEEALMTFLAAVTGCNIKAA